MAAITHQKYDEKVAIYNLVKEYVGSLGAEERMKFVLALTEAHMAKLSLPDLRDWRRRLEKNKPTWKAD